jgi:hypothetical protein
MILGDGEPVGADGPTLDGLFRRAGVRDPHAPALADPPDRERFADGAPRRLTFAQADHAISAFAARLCTLGLKADAVIGLQLPNTVESVVALLGTLRAGMIAAPMPLLWRGHEMREALARVGASAIVTADRIGNVPHAEIAMQVAADLFPIRQVCAFGAGSCDGIVPLDDVFAAHAVDALSMVRDCAADHIAVVTFESGTAGLMPRARNQAQLIAGGRAIAAESGIAPGSDILTSVPFTSFAACSAALVPWLIAGGTLHLHHAFDAPAFAAQCGALDGGTVVVPGPALDALAHSIGPLPSVIALWRSPEQMTSGEDLQSGVIDVACFGEVACISTQRSADGSMLPLPCGWNTVQTKHGTLAMRGLSVPTRAFPADASEPVSDGFVDTGFACRIDHERGTLAVTAGPPGTIAVGAYRFRRDDLDARIADTRADAVIAPLPDALLGDRLAGRGSDPVQIAQALERRGLNPLIANAFRPRPAAESKSH